MTPDELREKVLAQYLGSRDFNGYPVHQLQHVVDYDALIASAVRSGTLNVAFGDGHPNPHIQALPPDNPNVQIQKIGQLGTAGACLYPTKATLAQVVRADLYRDEPFKRMIALGDPVLDFRVFDLSVLELYRNDPRYRYRVDDIHGQIGIRDEHDRSEDMSDRDKVFLETFGFAHDRRVTSRHVAVFLRYLSRLTPEHQQIWQAKMLTGAFLLHPDYARSSAGAWPLGISVFAAILHELQFINELSVLIGRPPLFREEFADDRRPRELGFLLRPTQREYDLFVHVFDKILSDNINRDFFRGLLSLEEEQPHSDGRVIVQQKGTLRLLDEWLRQSYRSADPETYEEVIAPLKKVRSLRQKPAHAVTTDAFEMRYFQEQRTLASAVHKGLVRLRLILAQHPAAANFSVPDYYDRLKIWNF